MDWEQLPVERQRVVDDCGGYRKDGRDLMIGCACATAAVAVRL